MACFVWADEFTAHRQHVAAFADLTTAPAMTPAEGGVADGELRAIFCEVLSSQGKPTKVFCLAGYPEALWRRTVGCGVGAWWGWHGEGPEGQGHFRKLFVGQRKPHSRAPVKRWCSGRPFQTIQGPLTPALSQWGENRGCRSPWRSPPGFRSIINLQPNGSPCGQNLHTASAPGETAWVRAVRTKKGAAILASESSV